MRNIDVAYGLTFKNIPYTNKHVLTSLQAYGINKTIVAGCCKQNSVGSCLAWYAASSFMHFVCDSVHLVYFCFFRSVFRQTWLSFFVIICAPKLLIALPLHCACHSNQLNTAPNSHISPRKKMSRELSALHVDGDDDGDVGFSAIQPMKTESDCYVPTKNNEPRHYCLGGGSFLCRKEFVSFHFADIFVSCRMLFFLNLLYIYIYIYLHSFFLRASIHIYTILPPFSYAPFTSFSLFGLTVFVGVVSATSGYRTYALGANILFISSTRERVRRKKRVWDQWQKNQGDGLGNGGLPEASPRWKGPWKSPRLRRNGKNKPLRNGSTISSPHELSIFSVSTNWGTTGTRSAKNYDLSEHSLRLRFHTQTYETHAPHKQWMYGCTSPSRAL